MDQRFRLAVVISHPIQYFAPLYRRLAQQPDIDLTVYFCGRQGLESYEDAGFGMPVQWDIPLLEGYDYEFLPNLRRREQIGGFFSLVNPGLVSELRRNRYDALLASGHVYFSYVLGILAAKLTGIPVFMRCETHLLLRRSSLKAALRRPVMTFFYRVLCDRCLPIGTRNREFYLAHGVRHDRLFDVPYVVDNDYFVQAIAPFKACQHETRLGLGLPVDKPLILYLSKLTPRKRPHDLLAAFRLLRERGIEAALVFVGAGESEASLRAYADEHRIADVCFAGFRNQSELPKYYASADVFVLPSEDEPWGLVINEAMCAGLPIVASEEIGAVPDLVKHGYNGLTYGAGDVEQLAAHLVSLASNKALREQMGENSLAVIQEWDLERCVEGVSAALHSLGRAEGERR